MICSLYIYIGLWKPPAARKLYSSRAILSQGTGHPAGDHRTLPSRTKDRRKWPRQTVSPYIGGPTITHSGSGSSPSSLASNRGKERLYLTSENNTHTAHSLVCHEWVINMEDLSFSIELGKESINRATRPTKKKFDGNITEIFIHKKLKRERKNLL